MNDDIKRKIKKNRIMQYEVADQIGVSEFTLCRWLRKPLSDEKRVAILEAIETIKAGAAYD